MRSSKRSNRGKSPGGMTRMGTTWWIMQGIKPRWFVSPGTRHASDWSIILKHGLGILGYFRILHTIWWLFATCKICPPGPISPSILIINPLFHCTQHKTSKQHYARDSGKSTNDMVCNLGIQFTPSGWKYLEVQLDTIYKNCIFRFHISESLDLSAWATSVISLPCGFQSSGVRALAFFLSAPCNPTGPDRGILAGESELRWAWRIPILFVQSGPCCTYVVADDQP
jgi:hypothetical protein